ncbi:MAG TPA: DUF933 domain-containing protein, partial [Bacteroidota bacterium]|nr:DUF933 domain-containing protein [Bacteroidota bacterium]
EKHVRSGDKKAKIESEFYQSVKTHLSTGRLARYIIVQNDEEKIWMRDMCLLTNKPVMYVCNVREEDLTKDNAYVTAVREVAAKEEAKVVVVSAAVEAEISELPESERAEFLAGLGLQESGLTKVIHEGYDLLQLITFFTSGPKEVHAWTIRKGSTAPQAAGQIHSDFEQGFIRAEIIKFADLDRLGTELSVKEAGLLHVEGREYIMEDGDLMVVRFNV